MGYFDVKRKWNGLMTAEKIFWGSILFVSFLVLVILSLALLIPTPNYDSSKEENLAPAPRRTAKPAARHLVTAYVAVANGEIRLEPTTDAGIPHVYVTIEFTEGRTEKHEVFQTVKPSVSLKAVGTVMNVELETPDGNARAFYDCENVKQYCTRYRSAAKELR